MDNVVLSAVIPAGQNNASNLSTLTETNWGFLEAMGPPSLIRDLVWLVQIIALGLIKLEINAVSKTSIFSSART